MYDRTGNLDQRVRNYEAALSSYESKRILYYKKHDEHMQLRSKLCGEIEQLRNARAATREKYEASVENYQLSQGTEMEDKARMNMDEAKNEYEMAGKCLSEKEESAKISLDKDGLELKKAQNEESKSKSIVNIIKNEMDDYKSWVNTGTRMADMVKRNPKLDVKTIENLSKETLKDSLKRVSKLGTLETEFDDALKECDLKGYAEVDLGKNQKLMIVSKDCSTESENAYPDGDKDHNYFIIKDHKVSQVTKHMAMFSWQQARMTVGRGSQKAERVAESMAL